MAETRYDLRELTYSPSSSLAAGTIVDEFHIIEEQWKNLHDIGEEIKTYLEHKHSKELSTIK